MAIYDDGTGDAIFGGTGKAYDGGRLFKYNSTTGGWVQVAPQLSVDNVYSLVVYDDGTANGSQLYGGGYNNAELMRWNKNTLTWNLMTKIPAKLLRMQWLCMMTEQEMQFLLVHPILGIY